MRRLPILLAAAALAWPAGVLPAMAGDRSFVGVWADPGGTETFTKLVIHDPAKVTYCYVQSCRQMECSEWAVDGSTDAVFSHRSELGQWQFARIDADTIEGRFTPAGGSASIVTYAPE